MAQREVHRDMVAGMLDEDMPDSVRDDLIRMIVGSDSDNSSSSGVGSYKSSSSSDDDHQQEEKLHTYTTRRRFKKRNPTESLWYTRYLSSEQTRATLRDDDTHRDTKEFKGLFRISFAVFEQIHRLYQDNCWYNENRTDAVGVPCSNLELLILGALHTLGSGSGGRWTIQSSTNIDREVHRLFFKGFVANMASIQERFIKMPSSISELREVESKYALVGLPGCCGSVDVVHIGWDNCPASLLHLYKGKESYPSIAYEVIVNQNRQIMSVTCGHPGARNDKHIVRLDDAVVHLTNGFSWLSKQEWTAYCDATDHNKFTTEAGFYLICDGGYLRWPTLICPIKISERFKQLSRVMKIDMGLL